MNTTHPTFGFRFRRGLLLLPLLLMGCRSDGDRAGLLPRDRDPLMGADRIAPQNVPIPGRDGYGAAPRDPLFKGPIASRNKVESREPFRLTEDFTPAAMAARGTDHTEPLIIDDRRPTGVPTGSGAVRPAVAAIPAGPVGSWEQMVEELRRAGGRPFAPVKLPTGDYEFRCTVPLGTTGAMRQYTGIGASPLAAVTDVYQQVQADRK